MVTLILGKTLVFWSGTLAAVSFFMMLFTCMIICPRNLALKKRIRMHRHSVILAVIFVAIHILLALLSSLFSIWI